MPPGLPRARAKRSVRAVPVSPFVSPSACATLRRAATGSTSVGSPDAARASMLGTDSQLISKRSGWLGSNVTSTSIPGTSQCSSVIRTLPSYNRRPDPRSAMMRSGPLDPGPRLGPPSGGAAASTTSAVVEVVT